MRADAARSLLTLVRFLIDDPARRSLTQRDVAQQVNMALGTVNKYWNDAIEMANDTNHGLWAQLASAPVEATQPDDEDMHSTNPFEGTPDSQGDETTIIAPAKAHDPSAFEVGVCRLFDANKAEGNGWPTATSLSDYIEVKFPRQPIVEVRNFMRERGFEWLPHAGKVWRADPSNHQAQMAANAIHAHVGDRPATVVVEDSATAEPRADPLQGMSVEGVDLSSLQAIVDRAQKYGEVLRETEEQRAVIERVESERDQLQKALDQRAKRIAELEGRIAGGEQLQQELDRVRADYEQLAQQGVHATVDGQPAPTAVNIPTETDRLDAFVKACQRERSGTYVPGRLDTRSGKKGFATVCAERRKPLLLAGPSGCGKTELLQDLNAHVYKSWCQVNFDDGITRAQLICRQAALAGRTYWEFGPLVLSMLAGVPVILDEIDHCDTASQSAMHEAVRTSRLFVPEMNRMIVAKAPWWASATCNAVGDDTGMYHGSIGTAFKDRWAVRKLGYPTAAREAKIIQRHHAIEEKAAASIAQLFHELRRMDGESVSGPFSTRQAVEMAAWIMAMKDAGHDEHKATSEALAACLTDRVTDDEGKVLGEVAQRFLGVDAPTITFEELEGDEDE